MYYGYDIYDFDNIIDVSSMLGTGMVATIIFWGAITTAVSILGIVALWKVFEKAGKPGWASIIPIYNLWILYEIVDMEGWYSLLSLIPIAGPIIAFVFGIMAYLKLAKVFGKDVGFGIGLILVYPVFICILGFSDAQYLGSEYAH